MVADHNGVFILRRQPAPPGNDGVDQGRSGGRRNEQDLCPGILFLIGNERTAIFCPTFHAAHARNLLRDRGDFVKTIVAAEGNIDICQKVALDILNDLVEGSPQIVDADEDGSAEHEGDQRQDQPGFLTECIPQRKPHWAR